jgi:hypothetical protein
MKVGIMQPYFLPYIGYFALINAVDKFVFLDDVQYIRRGWVHRNRIKIADAWHYITLPIKKAPLSACINEVYIADDEERINDLKTAIELSYKRCPYYTEIKDRLFDLIIPGENVAKLNITLTTNICDYLKIDTQMVLSSDLKKDASLKGSQRILDICKVLNGDHYINPIGGTELYSKQEFAESGIKLNFLQMNEISYFQGKHDFIPNLSIIDVLMWSSPEAVKDILGNYRLV